MCWVFFMFISNLVYLEIYNWNCLSKFSLKGGCNLIPLEDVTESRFFYDLRHFFVVFAITLQI